MKQAEATKKKNYARAVAEIVRLEEEIVRTSNSLSGQGTQCDQSDPVAGDSPWNELTSNF